MENFDLKEHFSVTLDGKEYTYNFNGLKAKLLWEECSRAAGRPRVFNLANLQDWVLYFFCVLNATANLELDFETFINTLQEDDLSDFINNAGKALMKGNKNKSDDESKKA